MAIIVRDISQAYATLRSHGVIHASTGPQRLPDWNRNAGGIEAFYFRDPDGHFLEILHFPDGKGRSKWHRPGQNLFLGLDHTAIVVDNTTKEIKTYPAVYIWNQNRAPGATAGTTASLHYSNLTPAWDPIKLPPLMIPEVVNKPPE